MIHDFQPPPPRSFAEATAVLDRVSARTLELRDAPLAVVPVEICRADFGPRDVTHVAVVRAMYDELIHARTLALCVTLVKCYV